jgi:Fatty acid/phospholipid biosynthesis enzyme
MLTIAVDAMGGDHAPKSEVAGSIQAVNLSASKSFWSGAKR